MKIIVGLGNPGVRYQTTRHNIGFQVVDRFASINDIPIQSKRFKSLYGTGRIDSEQIALLKPKTFMNLSGEAVQKATAFFRIHTKDLIVVHDDLDLPFGKIRFKQRGGDGGHQGLRSIIECLGQDNFLRLKIGIGRPPGRMDSADYVLAPFTAEERSSLDELLTLASESLKTLLSEGLDIAMNRYQKREKPEPKTKS